jgi:phage head maturation protease
MRLKAPKFYRGALQEPLEIRTASYDEAARTIEVVWTTGARVRRYDWRSGQPYDEELVVSPNAIRLDRLNKAGAFLNNHSDRSLRDVLGSVVQGSIRFEKGAALALVRLTRAPDVADIIQRIVDGDVRSISTGYRVHLVEKTEKANGEIGLWRCTDWEPWELSAVAIPADDGAHVRAADNDDMNEIEFIGANPVAAAKARMRMRAAAARV